MKKSPHGIVYLVGAGPGDAGLITVRGAHCLRRADVVVYDNLANPELLHYVPAQAQRIYAGKRPGQHSMSQEDINSLLSDKAAEGHIVVRLKGGDPFVFGRGSEEAQWLTEQGIPWQVVPGITSAIAAPAYAGIPVTHREMATSVHFVTGHESAENDDASVNWQALAQSGGTIVLLMGMKNLPSIVGRLMRHGMPADMPVAAVQWGTRAAQRTAVSTLERVVENLTAEGMAAPCIIVIGKVVNLRQILAWVEQRPLFGLRVGVTRPIDENNQLAGRLEDAGAEVVRLPTMKLMPLEVSEQTRSQLAELAAGGHQWLAFTSGNGVRQFVRILLDAGLDLRLLANVKIAVIGERTAAALKGYGLIAELVVQDSRQEGLAQALIDARAQSVLITRAKDARPVLEDSLHASGVRVAILPSYEMAADREGIDRLHEALLTGALDVVCFTSARTFEVSNDVTSTPLKELLGDCAVAVMGPVTRHMVEVAGVTVQMQAEQPNMDSLVAAIAKWRNAGAIKG